MNFAPPLTENLPPPEELERRLGAALREVELLRRLLRVSERAARYRKVLGEKAAAESGKEAGCA
jgi:hypothetical protein